jgi:hypothetical protein
MEQNRIILIIIVVVILLALYIIRLGSNLMDGGVVDDDNYQRSIMTRKDYYRDVYLKSDAWQRKRYLVLKRDNYTCVHCGYPATDVHHKKYARKIGKEPIHWLEAVCRSCHVKIHGH